jgi:hypothetical protein
MDSSLLYFAVSNPNPPGMTLLVEVVVTMAEFLLVRLGLLIVRDDSRWRGRTGGRGLVVMEERVTALRPAEDEEEEEDEDGVKESRRANLNRKTS